MTSRRLRNPQGWNVGFLKAITLPDGAFKLYVWLRLNARFDTGSLETSQLDLARALKKARGTIRTNLKTLERAGVCRMKFPRNPHARGSIQIMDPYWPYERGDSPESPELRSYLDRIRTMVGERACIRCPFSMADEVLVRQWHTRTLPVERIGQAILLGCARKYVAWRNGAPRVPIGSLAYFEPILVELHQQQAPAEYWDYTRHRIERMEKLWLRGKESDDPSDLSGGAEKTQKGGIPEYGSASDR